MKVIHSNFPYCDLMIEIDGKAYPYNVIGEITLTDYLKMNQVDDINAELFLSRCIAAGGPPFGAIVTPRGLREWYGAHPYRAAVMVDEGGDIHLLSLVDEVSHHTDDVYQAQIHQAELEMLYGSVVSELANRTIVGTEHSCDPTVPGPSADAKSV